jgi:hypothetical protein
MNRGIVLAVLTLSISVCCYSQRDTERGMTDRNYVEQYAAHMIRIAYYERGYMGVRVQVRDEGERKVFEVVPGRVYHLKAMQILPKNDLPAEAMSTAPTVGDVYSDVPVRMNDWIATLKSRYNRTAAHWGVRLDHANAEATIEVELDGGALPDMK